MAKDTSSSSNSQDKEAAKQRTMKRCAVILVSGIILLTATFMVMNNIARQFEMDADPLAGEVILDDTQP